MLGHLLLTELNASWSILDSWGPATAQMATTRPAVITVMSTQPGTSPRSVALLRNAERAAPPCGVSDDAAETTATIVDLAKRLDKIPVEANDYPGFVANRILMPMINEAAFALMEGVASAEAIDEIMKLGMNHPMGPLALADLIGLDTCLSILEVLHEGLGDPKYRPCPLLRKHVEAGWLGRKSGRGFYRYA